MNYQEPTPEKRMAQLAAKIREEAQKDLAQRRLGLPSQYGRKPVSKVEWSAPSVIELWPYRQQRALRQDPWKHIERSPLSAVSSPETIMLQRQATDELGRILSALSPREERVLRFRFGIGCHEATLDEVATMFSVTRERIRQIEGKALRRLKHRRLSPRVSQCYEVLVA